MALTQSEANQTLIMGVVNITPDSFSDGGSYLDPERALTQIEKLVLEGADIVDLGAESSRPGAEPLGLEEEWRRLAPVLEQIRNDSPRLYSVWTVTRQRLCGERSPFQSRLSMTFGVEQILRHWSS